MGLTETLITCGSIAAGFLTVLKIADMHYKTKLQQQAPCPLHEGIQNRLVEGDNRMDKMGREISATRKVIVAVASAMKVSLEDIKQEFKELF